MSYSHCIAMREEAMPLDEDIQKTDVFESALKAHDTCAPLIVIPI